MNLSIKYNFTEENWDAFAAQESGDGGFLQSWGWGEFQRRSNKKIFRLAIIDGGKTAAIALIIKQEMPLGFCYLYSPRGPVIGREYDRAEIIEFLFLAVKKIAQKEQAIFFRLDPPWTIDRELLGAGCRFIGDVQPKSTLLLDLTASEDELLAKMKPKTRYNIKVAQKHQIEIISDTGGEKDFDEFWRLLTLTSERDGIRSHAKEYYRRMLTIPGVRLVFAKFGGKNVAANIMAGFGSWEIYLHGASDYDYRDKMAPYLLQWEMIRQAKAAGRRQYDFWGADAKRWPGVTRFKQGFVAGAALTEYVGAYDFVYNKFLYGLYNLYKKIFRIYKSN